MTEEVLKYIKKENLIEKGNLVLAGVSGGADSTCLLLVLKELKEKLGFYLGAVHVEHGIRGEESIQDAEFVEKLCKKMKVPCQVYRVNVREYAKKNGLGTEEAARILRYDCYRKAAQKAIEEVKTVQSESGTEDVKIALAHHADDNAETVLFQLIRGSGLDGLCGMKPVRALTERMDIIRPMLAVSREDIEAYLKEMDQEFRTDSTNLELEYSRNKIRKQILPELSQVNHQAVAHINQSAGILRELAEYLNDQVEALKKTACIYEEEEMQKPSISRAVTLRKENMEVLPAILQKELVHTLLCEAAGSAKDLTMAHIEAVCLLFSSQTGKRLTLPYGLIAERTYEGVRFLQKKEAVKDDEDGFCLEIKTEQLERAKAGEILIFDIPGGKLSFRILQFQGKMQEISKKRYTKWLDYDKIKDSLQIRNRKSGDYLVLDEAGHKKRLKQYFIDEKVPQSERKKKLLLAAGSEIIWVIGGRIGADVKVEKGTDRILEVRIFGGEYDEN